MIPTRSPPVDVAKEPWQVHGFDVYIRNSGPYRYVDLYDGDSIIARIDLWTIPDPDLYQPVPGVEVMQAVVDPNYKGLNLGINLYKNIILKNHINQYLGKTSEIDAHANGAAAEVVNRIISNKAAYSRRWNKKPSADDIDDTEWNDDINNAIHDVRYLDIPDAEFHKYINSMDPTFREQYNVNPTIKDQFLKKVRQKFFKTYIRRLQTYLRPASKK
jgi:hypothetical protein